jgi:peptidoglycan/xylan/chitin deacetylase (PgdA/CDA1 family)
MTTPIPVLLYHSVNDRPQAADRRWTVTPADFAAHVGAVMASGRTALTITQIADCLRRELPMPERPVAVTFDDGFADTYRALTTLGDRGLVATLYVTTGELGRRDRLRSRQLPEIADGGMVEIGAHAVHHRRLDLLEGPDAHREVWESKARLEDLTEARVRSFAYPHGAYDASVRASVVAAGYRSAAAVKNALSHDRDDPFAVARWIVEAGTPASRIAEVLEGERVPLAWTGERLRTRVYRAVRRGGRGIRRRVGVAL